MTIEDWEALPYPLQQKLMAIVLRNNLALAIVLKTKEALLQARGWAKFELN